MIETENIKGKSFLEFLKKFLYIPIKGGSTGFVLVLSVIILIKLLSFMVGINAVFQVDFMDVMLSSVGFFFMFLIYILKNFH